MAIILFLSGQLFGNLNTLDIDIATDIHTFRDITGLKDDSEDRII